MAAPYDEVSAPMPDYSRTATEAEAAARQIPQVDGELAKLAAETDRLVHHLDRLHGRLEQTVLRPSDQVAGEPQMQEVRPMIVPVAEAIRSQRLHIGVAADRVMSILERLEV